MSMSTSWPSAKSKVPEIVEARYEAKVAHKQTHTHAPQCGASKAHVCAKERQVKGHEGRTGECTQCM